MICKNSDIKTVQNEYVDTLTISTIVFAICYFKYFSQTVNQLTVIWTWYAKYTYLYLCTFHKIRSLVMINYLLMLPQPICCTIFPCASRNTRAASDFSAPLDVPSLTPRGGGAFFRTPASRCVLVHPPWRCARTLHSTLQKIKFMGPHRPATRHIFSLYIFMNTRISRINGPGIWEGRIVRCTVGDVMYACRQVRGCGLGDGVQSLVCPLWSTITPW